MSNEEEYSWLDVFSNDVSFSLRKDKSDVCMNTKQTLFFLDFGIMVQNICDVLNANITSASRTEVFKFVYSCFMRIEEWNLSFYRYKLA